MLAKATQGRQSVASRGATDSRKRWERCAGGVHPRPTTIRFEQPRNGCERAVLIRNVLATHFHVASRHPPQMVSGISDIRLDAAALCSADQCADRSGCTCCDRCSFQVPSPPGLGAHGPTLCCSMPFLPRQPRESRFAMCQQSAYLSTYPTPHSALCTALGSPGCRHYQRQAAAAARRHCSGGAIAGKKAEVCRTTHEYFLPAGASHHTRWR